MDDEIVYLNDPNEAGGVAFCDLFGIKNGANIVKISVTARAKTAVAALDSLIEAIKHAEEKYNMRPYLARVTDNVRSDRATVQNSTVQSAPVRNAPANAPVRNAPANAPVQSAPVPANDRDPNEEDFDGGVMQIERFTVAPRADGKSAVSFFAAGHRYADLTLIMTPEKLAAFFAPAGEWLPENFKAAAEYQIRLNVRWENSEKLNRNNVPYKNVVGISL